MSAPGHSESAGAELMVPLHSRRRQRGALVQKLQHVIAGTGLFLSGMQSLSAGAEGLELTLAVAGMITAGLLMVAFLRAVRGLAGSRGTHAAPAHQHRGVDWMDLFAAGMLFAEAAEKYHLRGHIWRPETLAAVVTLGLGLFHGRIAAYHERRRSMRLTGDRLIIGGRNKLVRDFTATWDEIAEVAMDDREATIRTHQGARRRINLADLENAPDVRAALTEAQRRIKALTP